MIEIIPAIDLIDGKCQRLQQGDFEWKTVYPWEPRELALIFYKKGFRRLHLVDLEGAEKKRLVHTAVLRSITQATTLSVDYGGGVRQVADVREILEAGADYVTIGSLAVQKPALLKSWMEKFGGERFILAADIREGKLTTHAWKNQSDQDVDDLIESLLPYGLQQVLCTDISRDGMLQGIDRGFYVRLREKFPDLRIIASGGVSSLDDLKMLEQAGIDATVVGKAIFEGMLDLDELIGLTSGGDPS